MKLATAAEMKALEERAAAEGRPASVLMENAGKAVAAAVRRHLGGARARRIVVLVGPGNNGGDGLVAARHLYDFGADIFVYLAAPRPQSDPNLELIRGRDLEIVDAAEPGARPRLEEALELADAIIDAILGSGRIRPLEGALAEALNLLGGRRCPLFAVDVPTGVDADSGTADPNTVAADVTLALGVSKVGLHTWPGSSYTGQVEVLDIGLTRGADEVLPTELLTPDWAHDHLPARPAASNKGTFGRVLIVAGSASYMGAAALTAIGALRAGAGLVTLAAIDRVCAAVASQAPEVTYLPLPEEEDGIAAAAGDMIARALPRFSALVIGPGMGQTLGAQAVVRGVLSAPAGADVPAVIDADALNALARWPAWTEDLKMEAVLTPHPGELSRLTGESISDLQNERLTAARRCAETWRQTVILKGAHTIVAAPDGAAFVAPFATASLATAGTGDVLAGITAGLIAQGLTPRDAAALGVYLHGAAAESFRDELGESGLLAGELARAVARAAASLRRRAAHE
jgi:NAD(P)H-hydrate epimerase